MIPLSVRMTGWMRYRDETVADFSHGTLIAICGENGAGKSSIFDAITFALYGQHRLGKMQAAQLISEDRDRLSVEFEFESDNQRYLVRRSRGHKQGERDQSLWVAGEGDEWAQVPGTEKEDALDRAIAHVVRLSHEAFTASFLLQQGEATAFIDADPKPRFEIISSLIGLKEYEALEKAAREAAKTEKILLDDIIRRIEEAGDADAVMIARLRTEVAAAAQRETDAGTLLQATRTMLADAQRYARLAAEITALDQKIAQTADLLAQKEQIEKDAALFKMLATTIDGVSRIQAALADAARAEAAAAEAQRQAASIDVDALTAAQAAATKSVTVADDQCESAEATHGAASKAERAASDFLGLAASVLESRARIVAFEQRIKEIDAALQQASGVGGGLKRTADASLKQHEVAETVLEAARKEGADWRARADQMKRDLTERKAAAKEAKCARCGQPIDKAAAKKEIEALTAQLAEAQTAAATATAAEQAAAKARTAAKKTTDEATTGLANHLQQVARFEAASSEAAASLSQAGATLAEQESQLDGRLKDVPTAEASHQSAAAKLQTTVEALDATRAQQTIARTNEQRTRAALDEGMQRQALLASSAREQSATAAGHRDVARTAAATLGEIGERALEDPAPVLDALRTNQRGLADAPKRKAALDQAQQEHTTAAAQREAKQDEVDAIPAAHQIDAAAAAEAARDADAAATTARADHSALQQQLTKAEAAVEQIERLRADKERALVRHKRLNVLTRLLGKKGLQGVLVSDALVTITNHANAFLNRLTGGSLQLTLERDGDALELKAIDHTCMREPRSAKALSGSQKFRCAVAIASGIGQYAGAGGMRSIVIDEGFGSLDQDSQRQMVDELKQLAQHMDKVIVVSHLEAFTDPANFPDRLEVHTTTDGASTITRA